MRHNKKLRRELDKTRDTAKTCGASRHTHIIVEWLSDPKNAVYRAIESEGFEPEHMAASIGTVLLCLWEARQFMEWERLPPTKRHPLANGRWVPIREPRHD